MRAARTLLTLALASALAGCGGGSSTTDPAGTAPQSDPCDGGCAGPGAFLSVAEVEQILARGVAEAQARGVDATLAVVDRVGNVLAVYRMGPAAEREVLLTTSADGSPAIDAGLEGIRLPVTPAPVNLDDQAAIAKAVTGAYLSSEGNAFTTRTASQIVQEHFNPGETDQPAGPLFGVQFSQFACSDFTAAFDGTGPSPGPHRSPLGLSADPGGLPLYEDGTVVGGIGVLADGVYGLDKMIFDDDADVDEAIALAASFGFLPPADRRAERITVEGKVFRFSDVEPSELASDPEAATPLAALAPGTGALVPVTGYFDGTIRPGLAFGSAASGIRADGGVDFPGQDAFVFVDATDTPRFRPRAGTDGAEALTAEEVRTVLASALGVAERARAQIRRPLGTPARVTISVVDTNGEILGMVRSRDAPVFGADVSLQKARTATFFSSATAGPFLRALPDAKYLETTDTTVGVYREVSLGAYADALESFLGTPDALSSGEIAFSDRAGGNLSRPFFPDGITSAPPGPLSKPRGRWSPFSTGLQLDVAINALLQHVLFVASAGTLVPDVGAGCAGVDLASDLSGVAPTVAALRIANGLQIFPGSVPIYRDGVLVGGIGVSGDGVDQDDMIAFLGVHEAGEALGTGVGNAPPERRADTLTPQGVRLRYVQCPQAPFLDSAEDDVCQGR